MSQALVKTVFLMTVTVGFALSSSGPAEAGGKFLSKFSGKFSGCGLLDKFKSKMKGGSDCCAPAPVCCEPAPEPCCAPAPAPEPCCAPAPAPEPCCAPAPAPAAPCGCGESVVEAPAPCGCSGEAAPVSTEGYNLAPGETLVPGSVEATEPAAAAHEYGDVPAAPMAEKEEMKKEEMEEKKEMMEEKKEMEKAKEMVEEKAPASPSDEAAPPMPKPDPNAG